MSGTEIDKTTNTQLKDGVPVAVLPFEDIDRKKNALRLLMHLDYAGIPDVVCQDNFGQIGALLCTSKWNMCDVPQMMVSTFIEAKSSVWARSGYVVVIEGGTEQQRRRVMNYCLLIGIYANFRSRVFLAKIYDIGSILFSLSQYRDVNRMTYIKEMSTITILGVNELDMTVEPQKSSGIDIIMTSILRKRRLGGLPTVISLRVPSSELKAGGNGFGTELQTIVYTKHDEKENKVIRLKLTDKRENE